MTKPSLPIKCSANIKIRPEPAVVATFNVDLSV
jgi:hypothetical protein